MPNIYENQTVSDWGVQMVRERMEAEREDRTDHPWHASEVDQCGRKSIRQRQDPRPPDAKSLLMFAAGFALQEYFLGKEADGQVAWGIVLSADKVVKGQVIEFKTTRKSYYRKKDDHKFDPAENASWIHRTGMYCAHHGVSKAHILVFFIFSSQLVGYTLEFTDAELKAEKARAIKRRNFLDRHWKKGTLPPVTDRSWDGECTYCPYLAECAEELKAERLVVTDKEMYA